MPITPLLIKRLIAEELKTVADAGSLRLLNKSALTRHIGALSSAKRAALDAAVRFALGLD